jgi:DNA-binding NarL/FixJ family response regulator
MRLLVVDAHPIVATGIRSLLTDDADIVVANARSLREARKLIAKLPPDVIVLDINLPDGSGLQLCDEIVKKRSEIGVIVYAMTEAPILAFEALHRGARGFVSKSGESGVLKQAIRAVAAGELWLTEDYAQQLAFLKVHSAPSKYLLSPREHDIIVNLSQGRNIAQVAKAIAVSYWTVVRDCENLKAKLKARNSTELIRIALELKLV